MTAALSPETALEIIASHGADPARWPADVRGRLLALATDDAVVAAALAEARALDAMLGDWAGVPAEGLIDVAAITALPQQGTAPRRAAGWRPALLAASLALVVAVGGWLGLSGPMNVAGGARVAAVSPSAETAVGEADVAFAYVFTPTAAEEDLI